jgi:hypothetical protein
MDVSELRANEGVVDNGRTRRETTMAERQVIFYACRATMVNGRIQRGIFGKLAKDLGFERKTISRQWKSMQAKLAPLLINHPAADHGKIILDNHHFLFGTKQTDRRKGKYKYDRVTLTAELLELTSKARRSVRHLAGVTGLPMTVVHYLLKPRPSPKNKSDDSGVILYRHSSSLKPTLTETQKLWRFMFACSQVNSATVALRGDARFHDQFDRIHTDEKWFWICQDGEKYILVEGEEPPKRHVRHKNYMEKVMFFCAQARPRYDYHKRCV